MMNFCQKFRNYPETIIGLVVGLELLDFAVFGVSVIDGPCGAEKSPSGEHS